MTSILAAAAVPLLRRMDPERAQSLALLALRLGLGGRERDPENPALSITALGLQFPNPLGLAAGFDKNGVAIDALMRLGFGFVEAGTVTPLPQPGNAYPRLFRLVEDRAVVNRMGFNNEGLDALVARLGKRPRGTLPLGVNIGINRTDADPERDYPAMVAALRNRANYIVLNVSSPNTPGLRDLQTPARLRAILAAIKGSVPSHPPLLVKLAPDLSCSLLEGIIGACLDGGVQGLIIANTTTSRPRGLRSPLAREAGGLSGAPLFGLATSMLARASLIAGRRLHLIGTGGIFTGRDALKKIQAGASLVQLYTSFAYTGPALIPRLKRELAAALRAEGFTRVEDAIGTSAERLAGTA